MGRMRLQPPGLHYSGLLCFLEFPPSPSLRRWASADSCSLKKAAMQLLFLWQLAKPNSSPVFHGSANTTFYLDIR